jgi:hypothetical protein
MVTVSAARIGAIDISVDTTSPSSTRPIARIVRMINPLCSPAYSFSPIFGPLGTPEFVDAAGIAPGPPTIGRQTPFAETAPAWSLCAPAADPADDHILKGLP